MVEVENDPLPTSSVKDLLIVKCTRKILRKFDNIPDGI